MYSWIKLPYSLLDDFDFLNLSPAAAGFYFKLYLFAAKQDAAGAVVDQTGKMSDDRLAWYMRCTSTELKPVIEELITAGFLSRENEILHISRYFTEQGPDIIHSERQREKWRDWQRSRREKLKLSAVKEEDKDKDKEANPDYTLDVSARQHDSTLTIEEYQKRERNKRTQEARAFESELRRKGWKPA